MQDFIAQAASQLGIDEGQASGATGAIMNLLKDNADADDFGAVSDKVPGLSELLASSGGGDSGGGGGLLGGLAGALGGGSSGGLGGLLGKATEAAGAGGVGSLISTLAGLGLSTDIGKKLVGMLVSYLTEKAGGELISKLLGSVPGLDQLAG
jgi:hypothetical protein